MNFFLGNIMNWASDSFFGLVLGSWTDFDLAKLEGQGASQGESAASCEGSRRQILLGSSLFEYALLAPPKAS